MSSKLSEKVFNLVSQIPKGKVTTYKLLAEAVDTKAYRYIGYILSKNENAPVVPCHRVIKSSGELGGYSGSASYSNIKNKVDLLLSEGIKIENGKVLDFDKYCYDFPL